MMMYTFWLKSTLLVCMSICCLYSRCDASTKSFRSESEESALPHHAGQDSIENVGQFDSTTHVFREFAADLTSRVDLVKKERVAHDHVHEVVFAVQQKNVDLLIQLLHKVSDPDSRFYGQHRSRVEIEEIASNPTSKIFLLNYLQDSGATITAESVFGEYITAQAPVSLWEQMFQTEFYKFHHSSEEEKGVVEIIRAEKYSVPFVLHEHVTSVFQTIQMIQNRWGRPVIYQVRQSTSILQNHLVLGSIQPEKLNRYYSIDNNTGSSLSSQAVFQSNNQYVSPNDLASFQTAFKLPKQDIATFVGGGKNDDICTAIPETCSEGNLDMQYIMAISQGTPTTNWYTDLDNFSGWLLAVANTVKPPAVISISYGATEKFVSASEFDAFNLQAIKLGLMGVTILVSSGDDGVQSFESRVTQACGYNALFPASSPYVTAVGATQGPEAGRVERTCQSDNGGIITSGGGFSTYFPLPDWQSKHVRDHFDKVTGTPHAPVPGFSKNGRGYPDLSLAGTAYRIIIGGRWYSASGTSASTPVFAGMIALINSARLNANMPTVGWLNPTLYKKGQAFMIDVVEGQNNCGVGLRTPCCSEGFSATTGWDPTTGLGSVNFALFKREMMRISSSTPSASPQLTRVPSILRAPAASVASRKPIVPIVPLTKIVTRSPTVMKPSPTVATTLKPTTLSASPKTLLTRIPTRTHTSRPSQKPTAKPSIRKSLSTIKEPTYKPSISGPLLPKKEKFVAESRINEF